MSESGAGAGGRPPVLVVHGYLATQAVMRPMQLQLRRKGFDARLVDLSPFCIQCVKTLAAELAANVARVKRETGADRVDVVGVSQGGTIALRYVQHLDGARHVRRFVAVGTPFLGTWAGLAAIPVLGGISTGLWQTLPNSDIVREAVEAGIPDEVEITSICMTGDLVAPPASCALPGARHVVLRGAPSPLTHQWLVMSRRTLDAIARTLAED